MVRIDKAPTRQCCVTRKVLPADALIRFALSPDGVLLPDVDAKAPGRGVWVGLSLPLVEQAVAKKAFQRSLKAPVSVPPDLAQQVLWRLEERLLGSLGLARKAGNLLTGAHKVAAALQAGRAVALFTATDAAPDSRRKMLAALRRTGSDADLVPHFELLSSERLGLVLGLENVIHAALVAGPAASAALARAQRLARYVADAADRKTEFAGQDGPDNAELARKN